MAAATAVDKLTTPFVSKDHTINVLEEMHLPHHSARSDQAVVLFPPDPMDDFWRRDAFGQHSHDFALDRRPDSVENETRGFFQSCDGMKTSFLVSCFHELEDLWGGVSAGH